MKSLIIVLALIVAVSCDVSHLASGDGWFKDENGYHYTKPEGKFDAPEEETAVVTEEPVEIEIATELVNDYIPPNDYLPPNNDLKEYLPPKSEEAKRKRQIPARKVHRRFVRRH